MQGAQKSFLFPRNTIISSKQKIDISPKITDFSVADKNTLKLMDAEGDIIFDYNASATTTPTVDKTLDAPHQEANSPSTSSVVNYVNDTIPAVKGLTATYLSNNVSNDKTTQIFSFRKIIIFIISFVFIGAAAYAVYFIRRKKFISNSVDGSSAGNDFEILDD